jgi:hypothetical protein
VIPSPLAGLLRCRIVKLKVIVRRVLRSTVPVLLVIVHAKVIVDIRAATCIQLVKLRERQEATELISLEASVPCRQLVSLESSDSSRTVPPWLRLWMVTPTRFKFKSPSL